MAGLALFLAANHMSPLSLIVPGIILVGIFVAVFAFSGKYRDWFLGSLFIVGIVLSIANWGDGLRAFTNGTWYSALAGASAGGGLCPNAVSADNAASVQGQQTTIEGDVVLAYHAATSSGSPTFLDFHDPYQGFFRVVIWGTNRSSFSPSPESMYLNHHVCVSGTVQTYAGAPEIIVDSPSAIQVVR